MTAHLVLGTRHLCPSTHHEGVVGRKDSDDVNAFGLELVVLLKVGREMLLVACALRIRKLGLHAYFTPSRDDLAGHGAGKDDFRR